MSENKYYKIFNIASTLYYIVGLKYRVTIEVG